MIHFVFRPRIFAVSLLMLSALALPQHILALNLIDHRAKLQSQIQHIIDTKGPDAPALYRPLRQLGVHHLEQRQYQQSAEIFKSALSLMRRNSGVWAIEQQQMLQLLIQTYARLGDLNKANRLANLQHQLFAREYEPHEEPMLIASIRLGDWYRNTTRYGEALNIYDEVRDLLSQQEQEYLLIGLLRREALSLYLAERCCAAEKLDQVYRLMQDMPEFDLSDRREAKLAAVDLAILEQKRSRIPTFDDLEYHAASPPRILGLKGRADVRVATRERFFLHHTTIIEVTDNSTSVFPKRELRPAVAVGSPMPMCSQAVTEFVPARLRNEMNQFYVDVEVRVNQKGKPVDINLEGNVPKKLRRYVRRILENSRYRPAIDQQGQMNEADLVFRQTFGDTRFAIDSTDISTWTAQKTITACNLLASR